MTIEINKDTEKLLSRIAKNAKIIIYGTAEAAIYLKNVIEEKRKDIKLLSFVNTYETGEIDGIPVIKPSSLPEIAKDVDVAIIASVYFADTMKFILLICGIKKYLKITPKILDISFKTKPSNMPDELVRKAQQVFDILDSDKDRDLYKMALDYRTHKDMISLPEYHKRTNKHYVLEYPQKHYFEFIKKSKIKTVLDIGAYDCTHSLLFLAKFPNIQKVYAFEPMYDTFKKDFLDELVLANKDKIENVKMAVWDKEETLEFQQHKFETCSKLVEVAAPNKDTVNVVKVQTISIDKFAQQHPDMKVDYIKMDVEGAEQNVLKGGIKTIQKDRPQLAISIYHTPQDFVEIPLYLHKNLKNYVFKLGHYCPNAAETVLYCIPAEIM